ncbi:hypothetical protein DEO72_LG10g960 [Vigna unguiculata]|uniref:Uncharacterized protein n=1 Tax=Vigna unguiculata TaxID=3917 RepID=A0A4D6NCT9_VIGUN|nr:hypothetical protein DEO72_LG10g960 [Vigna unguiculata]
MASTTMARVLMLVILCTLFITLQARNLHGHPFIPQNNVAEKHHQFHHKYLGLDLSEQHMHLQDAAADVPHKDGNTHRLAPEGPDPHHNFAAPPN